MSYCKIETINNSCETFFDMLDFITESRFEKEFNNHVEMLNNCKALLDMNIRLEYKSTCNPADAMALLDELCDFYTEVLKHKCFSSKWVKCRNKNNETPVNAILDFLEDLGYEMHNKALELKDKKFSLLVNAVAMKGLEIFNLN